MVHMAQSATKEEIMKKCVNILFPNGYNQLAGNISEYQLDITNFKSNKILDDENKELRE